MRVALAKLLLSKPNLLLLDEPTNHLDLESRNWLEDYLKDYPFAYVLVSHDRYFLNATVNKILELWNRRAFIYTGGYDRYLQQKEERRRQLEAAYRNQQDRIHHLETFISRFRYQASKAKLVQSRIKQLEKIERLSPPVGADKPPAINFPQAQRSGRRVLELNGAVKRYGDLLVYDGLDLVIERGAKIALVGPNGAF